MIISTKGRYVLRVMIDLAQHPSGSFIPLQEIARRQGISKEYLNGILKILVQHGHLISLRGKGGGYQLAYPPEHYCVGEILRLVEGNLAPASCVLDGGGCSDSDECRTYQMFKTLDDMINDYFDQIYLIDFLQPEVHEPEKSSESQNSNPEEVL